MLIPKAEYIRDKKHLQWIATLPCCVTGKPDVQAAHIRTGQTGGMGLKPCDSLTVPLDHMAHRIQHDIGEAKFWGKYGGIYKAKTLAKELYRHSGDTAKALLLIREFRG